MLAALKPLSSMLPMMALAMLRAPAPGVAGYDPLYDERTSVMMTLGSAIWAGMWFGDQQQVKSPPLATTMVEMKVWRSSWGMTTFAPGGGSRVPVLAAKLLGGGNEDCAIPIGDALEPALTSFAMGVNSGACAAEEVVGALKTGASTAVGCQKLAEFGVGNPARKAIDLADAIRVDVTAKNTHMAGGLGALGNWAGALDGNKLLIARKKNKHYAGAVYLEKVVGGGWNLRAS